MGQEIQLAGICFSTEDWRAYDDETRASLLACNDDDWEDEPTLVRAGPATTRGPARADA